VAAPPPLPELTSVAAMLVTLNGVHEFLPGCSRTRSPWRGVLEQALWTLGLALVALAVGIIAGFRLGDTLLGRLVGWFAILLVAAADVVAQDVLGSVVSLDFSRMSPKGSSRLRPCHIPRPVADIAGSCHRAPFFAA
jgi:hypothetical protein